MNLNELKRKREEKEKELKQINQEIKKAFQLSDPTENLKAGIIKQYEEINTHFATWFKDNVVSIKRWSRIDVQKELDTKRSYGVSIQPLIITMKEFKFSLGGISGFEHMVFTCETTEVSTSIYLNQLVEDEQLPIFLKRFPFPEELCLFVSPHDCVFYLLIAFFYEEPLLNWHWYHFGSVKDKVFQHDIFDRKFLEYFEKFISTRLKIKAFEDRILSLAVQSK